MKKTLRIAFPMTIPVMLGYISVGIPFGLLVIKSGLSPWVALGMSLFVYAGAMQFVAIQLLLSPVGLVQVGLMTLFVNIRHLFYGLSFIELFKTFGPKKQYMIFALTDETYSLLCGLAIQNEISKESLFFAVSLLNQLYWISGTIIGVFLGSVIKFNTAGIEFALTALFIVIFIEQWLAFKTHIPALLGLAVSAISLMIFGEGSLIIPSMALMLIGLLVLKPLIQKREGGDQ
jgi:4-azaleucine resistance transporter AzlC